MQHFNIAEPAEMPVSMAQGLFGYTTYDAVQFFEDIKFNNFNRQQTTGGQRRQKFRLFVIAFINMLLRSIISKMNYLFAKIMSAELKAK